MIWIATALAGGGGIYADVGAGGGWSDAAGPLVRGSSGYGELGGYAGPYRGSMRYGRYTRIGVRFQYIELEAFRRGPETTIALPALTVGQGADLMNLGGYWLLAAGPLFLNVFDEDVDQELEYGAGLRSSVGAMYNVGSALGIALRLDFGLDIAQSISLTGGFGFNLVVRGAVKKPRDEVDTP